MFTFSLVVLAAMALVMCLSPGLVDLQELRDRRKAALDECEDIEKKAKAEKRDQLTDEEKKTVDERMAEFDVLTGQIDAGLADRGREARVEHARKKMAAAEPPIAPSPQPMDGPDLRFVEQVRDNRHPAIPIGPPLRGYRGPGAHEAAHRDGMWCKAVVFRDRTALQWCKDAGVNVRAMSEGVNTAGGYTVPEEFAARFINLQEEFSVFRRESFAESMLRDTKIIPRRTGGFTVYYVGENTAPAESEPTFDQVQLTARKPAILTRVSTELLEDSVMSFADFLVVEGARRFAEAEDDAGFNGDGTSTYGGIQGVTNKLNDGNHAGGVNQTSSGELAFSDVTFPHLETLIGMLPEYAHGNAKFYISRQGYWASCARLLDAAGGTPMTEIERGASQTVFMGYPVVYCQKLITALTDQASSILLLFGDLRQATTFGSRRDLRVMFSEHRYMDQDQIGILMTERYDIQAHDLGDSSVAGPIVGLQTPGS